MGWYRYIQTNRSKSERIRRMDRYVRKGITRHKKAPRIRPANHVFFKKFSRSIWINGRRVIVCTRNSMSKFFEVENTTVSRWADYGVLPEPFYHIPASSGPAPVYLASQVLVIRKVLADLVQQGYVTIPWSRLPEHVAMMHEGYRLAADRVYRKLEMVEEIEKPDSFGVLFN